MSFSSVVGFVLLVLLPVTLAICEGSYTYDVVLGERPATPAISNANPTGKGYSPCKYNFNPAWIPTNSTSSTVVFRAALCPPSFGGSSDHLLLATCYNDGHCDDVSTPLILPFESSAEDPRVVFYEGWYYMFYYASGTGESTVYLRKTQTPNNLASWQRVGGVLPWRRNGCVLLRDTPPHYVIFGESPALPGVGIAATPDLENFKIINPVLFTAAGANNSKLPEIVIEASTPVVQLSTGDYLHIYAAGTPGWVPNGNYTAGWIILDGTNPTIIKQRSAEHFFIPSLDYEGVGESIYPVQRNRTVFITSLLPTETKNEFRIWYGAADANVASALITVTFSQEEC